MSASCHKDNDSDVRKPSQKMETGRSQSANAGESANRRHDDATQPHCSNDQLRSRSSSTSNDHHHLTTSKQHQQSEQRRGRSAEPDSTTETSSDSSPSSGTYLVVPPPKKVPVDHSWNRDAGLTSSSSSVVRRSLSRSGSSSVASSSGSFRFMRSSAPLSLGNFPTSPLLTSMMSTSAGDGGAKSLSAMLKPCTATVSEPPQTISSMSDAQKSSSADSSPSRFRLLSSSIKPDQHQQRSPSLSEASSKISTGGSCAKSVDDAVAVVQPQLYEVREERVDQRRVVSVEREQYLAKEKAQFAVVLSGSGSEPGDKAASLKASGQGVKAGARSHRAVTISRSQTWSFRDKPMSPTVGGLKPQSASPPVTESSEDNPVNLSSVAATTLDDSGASSSSGASTAPVMRSGSYSTLPTRWASMHGDRPTVPVRRRPRTAGGSCDRSSSADSGEMLNPFQTTTATCVLMDYDTGKDWAYVPWLDTSAADGDKK